MITFRDIPGRHALKNRLADEIHAGRVGHAYVFEGPYGCGKKDIARAFSYMILCMGDTEEKPCMKCRHCSIVSAGGTGELYELKPHKGSISVNSIRELQNNINLLPVSGNKKVYLIADADTMTVQAQNCILKTLEEPPEYACILMTAVNSDKFIETIKSRAAFYQVGINSVNEIVEYLGKRTTGNPHDIQIAANCAGGSVGRALDILASEEFAEQRQMSVDFAKALISKEYQTAYGKVPVLIKSNLDIFFASLSGLIRDMLVLKETKDTVYLINSDKKDIIIRGSERYPGYVLSRIISVINETSDRIAANAAKKQSIDAMIVRIMEELAEW